MIDDSSDRLSDATNETIQVHYEIDTTKEKHGKRLYFYFRAKIHPLHASVMSVKHLLDSRSS